MLQSILLLVALVGGMLLIRRWQSLPPPERKKMLIRVGSGVLLAVVVLMVVTGRIHALAGLLAGLFLYARRLLPLLQYVPLLRRFIDQYKQSGGPGGQGGPGAQGGSGGNQGPGPGRSGKMSPAEARQILEVDADATMEEIVAAHRRLMQRVHPDRGGSNFLAAQINEAKSVLLDQMKS